MLQFPDDPTAVARADEYMWGKSLLVAPVAEKGASTRAVYLPHGAWHDFWTGERIEGGREISRAVDLGTIPLYARAGSILPLGPVKQHVAEKSGEPLSITVYPGADASFLLYEDDGTSFHYRTGEWMGIHVNWNDSRHMLTLRLADGSRMLPPARRDIEVKVAPNGTMHRLTFAGETVEAKL